MKFHTFLQNKLWRDKMPDQLRQNGSMIHTKTLDDAEYDTQLRIKLAEESAEVCEAKSPAELIEELADLYEVIDAFCALHFINKKNIQAIQEKKRTARGGFYQRAFVTIAQHPAGSTSEQYCRAQPDKYPEIE